MDYEPEIWVRASDIFLQVHIQLLSMDSLTMNLVRAETFFYFFSEMGQNMWVRAEPFFNFFLHHV